MGKFAIFLFLTFISPLHLAIGADKNPTAKKSAFSKENSTPPNVIIILADDLGFNDVGFNGAKDILTPNIDKIAKTGVKFTNAYVSYAVCGPSRAGIITGRYQDRFGFGRNPLFTPNDPEMGLPLSEETLATVLKKANYTSIALGKWHLGAHESLHPLKRGFDDFFGFLSGGHQYFPQNWTLNSVFEAKTQYEGYKTKLLRNYERVDEKEYLTDALSREATQYIEKNKDRPFFMYLAYNAPHTPLQATKKYLDRYKNIVNPKRRTYAAMISAMDDGVGLILKKLKELEISDNTIIFFLSDNGGPEHTNASDNGELRGEKGDLFEGGIHVPFAMRWPSKIKAGITYTKPVISLDIFATVVAQIPEGTTRNEIDGVNLIPFLTDSLKTSPHENLFWRKFDAKEFAVIEASGTKLLIRKKDSLLFQLNEDIGESQNLFQERKETAAKLKNEYMNWNSEMIEPTFMGLLQNKEYNTFHPARFKNKK